MPEPQRNQFGRRPGRGWRPWILLPKVITVGLFIGGLASTLAIWLMSGFASLDPADARRVWIISQFAGLLARLVVPSLLAALIFGAILLLQHPGTFVRMRWLVVKLISLAGLIPTAHLFMSSRVARLGEAADHALPGGTIAAQITWGLALTLAAFICIIILGRLKPRLGQNWAKAYGDAGRKSNVARS